MRRPLCWVMVFCLLLAGCSPALPVQETEMVQPSVTEVEAPGAAQPPRKEAPQTLLSAGQTPAEETAASAPQEETEKVPPVQETPQPPQIPAPEIEIQPGKEPVCRLSICCGKALVSQELDPALRQMLPQDGWLLAETTVELLPEETVFDVLLRVSRQQGIHMEFADPVVYGSAYIEGIGHLYEFDCGGQSGWIYTVNGQSPNVGCSSYSVKDGDIIVWEYITERT